MSIHHEVEYTHLPNILRELRTSAGLTQRALSAELGKPQSWVHNCETGERRVDVAEFVAWARACGASPRAALDRYLRVLARSGPG